MRCDGTMGISLAPIGKQQTAQSPFPVLVQVTSCRRSGANDCPVAMNGSVVTQCILENVYMKSEAWCVCRSIGFLNDCTQVSYLRVTRYHSLVRRCFCNYWIKPSVIGSNTDHTSITNNFRVNTQLRFKIRRISFVSVLPFSRLIWQFLQRFQLTQTSKMPQNDAGTFCLHLMVKIRFRSAMLSGLHNLQ